MEGSQGVPDNSSGPVGTGTCVGTFEVSLSITRLEMYLSGDAVPSTALQEKRAFQNCGSAWEWAPVAEGLSLMSYRHVWAV